MIDGGIVARIATEWSKKPPTCSGSADDLILGMSQVRTPFTIIGVGLVMAVILVIVERIYKKLIKHLHQTHPREDTLASESPQEEKIDQRKHRDGEAGTGSLFEETIVRQRIDDSDEKENE